MGTLKIISLRIHFRGPKACAKMSSRLYCKQAAYYSYIWNAIYVLTELMLVSARASSWTDGVCGCGLPPEPRGPQRLSYTTAEQPLFGAVGPRGPGSSCPALSHGPWRLTSSFIPWGAIHHNRYQYRPWFFIAIFSFFHFYTKSVMCPDSVCWTYTSKGRCVF